MIDTHQTPDVEGSLSRYPFPQLLFYLFKKQFTGLFVITTGKGNPIRLYVRDGFATYLDFFFAPDVLGRVLVERGFINEANYTKSLELLAQGGKLHGQILMEMNAITVETLAEGLRLQLYRKLNRLFQFHDAAFAIYSGEHSHGLSAETQRLRANPLRVVHQGIRNTYKEDHLTLLLSSIINSSVELPAEFRRYAEHYGFRDDELAITELLSRGAIPLRQIFDVSHLSPLETQMLMYSLWVTDVLIVDGEGTFPPLELLSAISHPINRPIDRPMDRPVETSAVTETVPSVEAIPHETPVSTTIVPAAIAPTFISNEGDEVIDLSQSFVPEASAASEAKPPMITPVITPPPDDGAFIEQTELSDTIADVESVPFMQVSSGSIPTSATVITPAMVPPAIVPRESKPAQQNTDGVYRVAVPKAITTPPVANPAGMSPQPSRDVDESMRQRIVDAHEQLAQQNHYEVLGVPKDALPAVVKDAYIALAKIYHPDRVKGANMPDLVGKAEELFRRINEAQTVLTDSDKRKAYDQELATGKKAEEAVINAFEAEAAFQRGVALFRTKQFAKAFEEFERAARLGPNEGEHHAWAGWALYRNPKSDRQKVLPIVKQRLIDGKNLSPKNANCHFFLGEFYLETGEEKKAIEAFETVIQLKPHHVDAARHLRIISMRKDRDGTKDKGGGGLFSKLKKK